MLLKILPIIRIVSTFLLICGCSDFKVQRVNINKSDEIASGITDKWVARDTQIAIEEIVKKMKEHKIFQKYMISKKGNPPRIFISEILNLTSDVYFPIDDLENELLNELSLSGDYELLDPEAREAIIKELEFQNDDMVLPSERIGIGKQHGAELMIFGNVYMQIATGEGKTLKEYHINIRMVAIDTSVEVFRTRIQINKYSEQNQ